MDFGGVVAHDFLNDHRGHSCFMEKSGCRIAEAVEGKGVFVSGFVLGGAVLFFIAFTGKGRVSVNEAASKEDFSEFVGQGGRFARMLVFLGR